MLTFVAGNEDNFFTVDKFTGNVTLAKPIDHETDSTFYTITITAQEYMNGDISDLAPEPSSSNTVRKQVYYFC